MKYLLFVGLLLSVNSLRADETTDILQAYDCRLSYQLGNERLFSGRKVTESTPIVVEKNLILSDVKVYVFIHKMESRYLMQLSIADGDGPGRVVNQIADAAVFVRSLDNTELEAKSTGLSKLRMATFSCNQRNANATSVDSKASDLPDSKQISRDAAPAGSGPQNSKNAVHDIR